MVEELHLSLARDDPLPLYHQIAVALRYRIATGRLAPGDRLPTLRDAAQAWQVNYHTVRRAYGLLEEMGLLERRRGAGTTITTSGMARRSVTDDELSRFLAGVVAEAHGRFGLSRTELARALSWSSAPAEKVMESPAVTMVECNPHQCHDLARQLADRFRVDVTAHLLGSEATLPPGAVVGTYFHLVEMRRAWPDRIHDMYFPAIHPDPALRSHLLRALSDPSRPVPLWEKEASLGAAMAEDIQIHLADDGIEVVPEIAPDPLEAAKGLGGPVLVAPRVWNDLPSELRARPELIEVRYLFRESDLKAIATALGLNPTG